MKALELRSGRDGSVLLLANGFEVLGRSNRGRKPFKQEWPFVFPSMAAARAFCQACRLAWYQPIR